MPEPISILLIEDDLVDQMAFRAQVAVDRLPYQYEIAGSVAEARRILTDRQFDLVIADFKLGDGTSFDLFDLLANQLVIFATGSGDEEIAARALHLGVRDYLIKDPSRSYLKLLSHRVNAVLQQGRSEKALRESEERYRDLFESANDLIQCVGMDGKILYANRAWREALGYDEAEVGGLSLLSIVHPSMHEHCMNLFKRVIGGETLTGIEATFISKDGREILVEGNTNCQMVEGHPVVTRSIFRDITEKRRAENALRAKNEELERLLAEVQQLQGILPICMYCRKVRDDQDYWQEVEAYVQEHTAAQFSHGVCPQCFKKWEAERAARKR